MNLLKTMMVLGYIATVFGLMNGVVYDLAMEALTTSAFYINVFYLTCSLIQLVIAFFIVCINIDQPMNSKKFRIATNLLLFIGLITITVTCVAAIMQIGGQWYV